MATTFPIDGISMGAAWVLPGSLGLVPARARSAPATSDPCPTDPGSNTGGLRGVDWSLVPPHEAHNHFFTLNGNNERQFLSKQDGFGGNEPPDGLMVPVGQTIDIQVTCRGWFDVRADCGSVLRVEPWQVRPPKDHPFDPGARRYSVTGIRADRDTYLRVYTRRGRVLDYLRVSVKGRRQHALKFWYLVNGDGSGGPGSISTRSRSDLVNLLKTANKYFIQQANTSFRDVNAATKDIKKSVEAGGRIHQLGDPLTDSELKRLVIPAVAGQSFDPSITAHVVFVWGKSLGAIKTETGTERGGVTFFYAAYPPVIFLQDEVNTKDAKLLAHELGHVLTRGHAAECHYFNNHSREITDLMYPDVKQDPNSMWIRLDEANVMNP
jgi:hypothetical protein